LYKDSVIVYNLALDEKLKNYVKEKTGK